MELEKQRTKYLKPNTVLNREILILNRYRSNLEMFSNLYSNQINFKGILTRNQGS